MPEIEFLRQPDYEKQLLSWIRKKIGDGLTSLKREKSYTDMALAIDYINGQQFPLRSRAISKVTDNRIQKIVLETVSSLTDVRPIWNYETHVEQFKKQAETLNKLSRNWWRSARADRKLQSVLTFAAAGGSGYAALIWNEDLPGGGDLEIIPYDPRDVVPIGPVYSDTIQDWRGVALRQRLPIDEIKRLYPTKAYSIGASQGENWFGSPGRAAGRMFDVVTTAWSVIAGRDRAATDQLPDSADLIRVFFKDDSIHTGTEPAIMGDPTQNWHYIVYPVGSIHPQTGKVVTKNEARLYPRGRLVVCTPDTILEDQPNPYWHGYFPVIRFTLDPLPWSILGASMVQGLIPLQNALNEALRGAEDGIGQWVRRGIVADKNAMAPKELDKLDSRKSGLKALLNPTAGEGFKIIDGPNLPDWYMKMLEFYISQMDDNSGVRGLQQLSQLKQMPAADTVEQFMEALSPVLRMRGRSLEISLSELAEQFKVGVFQFYRARTGQIVGDDGANMSPFAYDPQMLMPDLDGTDNQPDIDNHHRNFSFNIAPNSFLNVSHATQKMLMLQLFRDQGVDIYSLWEALDIPNIGPIPAENVPDRMFAARKQGLQPGPTPELVQVQEAAAVAQATAAIVQAQQVVAMGGMPLGPGGPSGPPGGGGSPTPDSGGGRVGRPPSGQELPQMVQKNGPNGPRTVISESGR